MDMSHTVSSKVGSCKKNIFSAITNAMRCTTVLKGFFSQIQKLLPVCIQQGSATCGMRAKGGTLLPAGSRPPTPVGLLPAWIDGTQAGSGLSGAGRRNPRLSPLLVWGSVCCLHCWSGMRNLKLMKTWHTASQRLPTPGIQGRFLFKTMPIYQLDL